MTKSKRMVGRLAFFTTTFLLAIGGVVSAQSITGLDPPTELTPGETYSITMNYSTTIPSIVQVQLFDPNWNWIDQRWVSVPANSTSQTISFPVPETVAEGEGYLWQALLYDGAWHGLDTEYVYGISVVVTQDPAITSFEPPLEVTTGETYSITTNYVTTEPSIVAVQLFDPDWNFIDQRWETVAANSTSKTISFSIPETIAASDGYLWQATLYRDVSWELIDQTVVSGMQVVAGSSGPEWLPPDGNWVLDWNDEFDGTGEPNQWYPMLGYGPDEFANNDEKGLRWSGSTPNTSWMFSTRSGNHWLDGNGNLVMQIVSKKDEILPNGPKVEAAYLISGFPEAHDDSVPGIWTRWGGKTVSPADGPLYISARLRTNEVVGYSTWFAFWLFSETRAYNGNPVDGTEVDIIEIAKGMPAYMNTAFNVANHATNDGTQSESFQFNSGTTPNSTFYVDVSEDAYHTYGIRWSQDSMTCYVDGKPYYTFTDNIPSDPVDMLMMLTFEFQKNLWDTNAGDGRIEGPFIDDQSDVRVMSRAYIDYVHVYRQQ